METKFHNYERHLENLLKRIENSSISGPNKKTIQRFNSWIVQNGLTKARQLRLLQQALICQKYFQDDDGQSFVCTGYQAEFLRKVLNKANNRFIVCAATGSGKSEIIAITISLMALLGENERIAVVSHTQDQSEIIFSKAKKHLVEDSPVIRNFVDTSKEFSKRMIFLKNGSSIRCFSSGVSEFGSESLLGFHCNVLVIDESASIDDSIYSQKILRMLGSAKNECY